MFRSILIAICAVCAHQAFAQSLALKSPDGDVSLSIQLKADGVPMYDLRFGDKVVIAPSQLGIELKDRGSLTRDLKWISTDTGSADMTWEPVWGEVAQIRDHHRYAIVKLQHVPTGIILFAEFRLFDDGLGFRYIFPEQPGLKHFIISNEYTQFALSGDHMAWWIPGDYDTNEYMYSTTRISQVNAMEASARNSEISTRSPIGDRFVQTPLMMKTDDGLYINIHEAALVNYPAMHLEINPRAMQLSAQLVPDAVGNKAYAATPFHTPWRTILVSDQATDILNSKLILNLNEPNAIGNTDFIKPIKYVGIWWEMHVGTSTWEYAVDRNIDLESTNWASLTPNGKHGATTERTKFYIDFAAANGFDGVLVEGWNVGWEDWFGQWKENVFDFRTPYPDFNLQEVSAYAKAKGVHMIMHHETSASVTNYERRLQQAMDLMQQYGYPAVKTGYVGRIIPRGEWHDGQWMVNHYVYVAAEMAKRGLMVDAHEPVRPTGLHRTYPNWLACEAARGNEFNAWSQGNPPEHETILPFTRLIGGPMDYTPGIFEIKMDHYGQKTGNQVHTTLVKQLALYVTMYSPLQMAADLPENYLKYANAFQFIKDVPVDWQDTRYIEAEPGDYITVARKEKNGNDWYLGAITDESARSTEVKLDFLEKGRTYEAVIYADAPDAHWQKNPQAYVITKQQVRAGSVLKLTLAPGGGAAVQLRALEEN